MDMSALNRDYQVLHAVEDAQNSCVTSSKSFFEASDSDALVKRLAKFQSAMYANLEEAQHKIKTLQKKLNAKERQLVLARKNVELLHNERSLTQVGGSLIAWPASPP